MNAAEDFRADRVSVLAAMLPACSVSPIGDALNLAATLARWGADPDTVRDLRRAAVRCDRDGDLNGACMVVDDLVQALDLELPIGAWVTTFGGHWTIETDF